MVEVNEKHMVGVLRDMYMEWFERLGVSNTYQMQPDAFLTRPSSIKKLESMIEDATGNVFLVNWRMDIYDQYNAGRRA